MTLRRAFWLTFLLTFLPRMGLFWAYPLASSNDSPTYLHLAASLRNSGLERYNGTRTPGYPAFLALLNNPTAIYLTQLLLGGLTALLVFALVWRLTRSPGLSAGLALAHSLNLGQLFFEASLLSETLATFFLWLALLGLAALWQETFSPPRAGLAAGIGLVLALLGLVRPLFVPLALWAAFFCLFWGRASWRSRVFTAVLLAAPLLFSLAVWVNFIHVRFKIWGLDSMGGYHLVNHVSSFFELAPDEYASIRDTFLQFRAQRLAESGSAANTIWDAIPTLMRQEKRNYYSLARVMGEISTRLMREHPDRYAWNLALGWVWFWKVGFFWLPETFSLPWLSLPLRVLFSLERALLLAVNALFLLFLPWRAFRPSAPRLSLFWYFAVSAVWLTSILQTLAEHGDNARFLAPMQSLVLVLVALLFWRPKKPLPTGR